MVAYVKVGEYINIKHVLNVFGALANKWGDAHKAGIVNDNGGFPNLPANLQIRLNKVKRFYFECLSFFKQIFALFFVSLWHAMEL